MLTIELLRGQTALAGISDEQLTLIATLSENDENRVIAEKMRETHEKYDQDIEAVTGEKKPPGMRSWEHMRKVLESYKEKAGKPGDGGEWKTKYETLKSKVDEGGGAAAKARVQELEQQLTDEKDRTTTLQKQLKAKEGELETAQTEQAAKIARMEVETKWAQTIAGATPRDGITRELFDEMVNTRKEAFFATTEIERIAGTEGNTFGFRRDGKQMNNEADALRPHTPESALRKFILDGLIKDGGGAGGGGRAPAPAGGGGGGGSLDLSGVTSKKGATEAIKAHLRADGIGPTHKDYQDKYDELWETVPEGLPIVDRN